MFPPNLTADRLQPSPEERAALEALGLARIPLETGLNVGPVNVTLVMGDPPALIDTALHHADNLDRLEASLQSYNIKLSDIGQIWITHPHIDHFGLTGAIIERSGAKTYALSMSQHRFNHYLDFWHSDRDAFYALMECSGVTEDILRDIRATRSTFHQVASPFTIDHNLEPDHSYTIAGRYELIPIHAPGHTPWCSAFWLPEIKTMVCGDVLRQKMRFNIILYPATEINQGHQGLPCYRRSLQKVSEMPVEWMIPGHGVSFQDHQKTITLAMRRQDKRRDLVLAYLQDNGPSTAYEIAADTYTAAMTERALLLIMSDIIALLDWLIEDGLAEMTERDGTRYYAPVPSSAF